MRISNQRLVILFTPLTNVLLLCHVVIDGKEIVNFRWAKGEPNSMYSSSEDKIMLLQNATFLWNDGRANSDHEYQQVNKALCECRSPLHIYTANSTVMCLSDVLYLLLNGLR